MWEYSSVPTLGDHPQHILNERIVERSDLLVAILWSRLGTPTPTARSGTVEEIREFVTRKGPRRVMLYFCTRDFPYDIDPTDLIELRDFKAEMRPQGVYHEYNSVPEFERDLYRHLDVKVAELLSGQLPLPQVRQSHSDADLDEKARFYDPRLRDLSDFGSSLQEIADGFTARMNAFRAIEGAGSGKFLDLGAHVCNSVAMCLDRFLAYSASGLDHIKRAVIAEISGKLKTLAAASSSYLDTGFPAFWADADKLALQLSAHSHYVAHLKTA